MLDQNDRVSISLYIVQADATIASLKLAQAAITSKIVELQKLDDANNNLFGSFNDFINRYQSEIQSLDANGRTQILESDLLNAANHTLGNFFFPNDISESVPSLAATNNIWLRFKAFALAYGMGKNYSEAFSVVTKEGDRISAINAVIATSTPYSNFELTTGTTPNGTCSIPMYVDQVTCEANSGIWTPSGGSSPDPNITTIKNNLVSAVNVLKSFLISEVALIVTDDPSIPNQTNNDAAINNINTVIIPALNTWLAYPDFEVTGSGPSKLHSTQLTALQLALSNRNTFITIRISQVAYVLGSISQDITTGIVSGSGLYYQRYGFLDLRLNLLTGTLTQITNLQRSYDAQTQIIANIQSTKALYETLMSVSLFSAPANGTTLVHVKDASLFSVGDFAYVFSEGQEELSRSIKSINGNAVTLSDIVPQKYTTSNNGRLYKVI